MKQNSNFRFPHASVKRLAALVLSAVCCLLLSCGNVQDSFRGLQSSTPPAAEGGNAALSSDGSIIDSFNSGSADSGRQDDSSDASSSENPPPTVQDRKVSLLAVGDDLIHRGIYRNAASYAKTTGSGSYDFTPIFENIRGDIAEADISIINQETMFDPEKEPSNYPNFNTPAEIADNLGALGFDVISLATNHMLDVGSDGLLRTITKLDSVAGVTRVGAYKDQSDMDSIRVLEKNGLRIAVVAFTYGTNGYSPSSSVKIPYLNEENVRSQLKKAEDAADFTIVFVHWGEENSYSVSDSQKKYASLFVQCGADAIIGSHPHVIQPIEWLDGEGGKKVPCVYSLGNLVSMMAEEYNMLGGVLTFDIVSKNGGEPYAENLLFRPTVYYYRYSDWFGNKIYYLDQFTDELAASHGVQHYNNTLKVKNLYKLAKRQIAEEFLPDYVKNYSVS